MSLQTPQLQEFTNQASQQSWGLWGPVHNISQWETSPLSPMPQRGQAHVETGQDSLSVLGARAPGGMDIIPSQPPSFQKAARSTFLELHLFSWGSWDGEGKPQHPESPALRGKFLHTVYTVFFY